MYLPSPDSADPTSQVASGSAKRVCTTYCSLLAPFLFIPVLAFTTTSTADPDALRTGSKDVAWRPRYERFGRVVHVH